MFDWKKVFKKKNKNEKTAKEKHTANMSAKLDNSNTAPKTHWSIISRILNKRKMPAIQPIPAVGKLVSNFKIKSDLFNSHFASQCTAVKNASTLPKFKYRTDKRLNSFKFNENDIFLSIKNLNADKAHVEKKVLPLQSFFKSLLVERILKI